MGVSSRPRFVIAVIFATAVAICATTFGAAASAPLFGPHFVVPVVSGAEAVAIGDVTGDHIRDLVVATGYSGNLADDFRIAVVEGPLGGANPPVSYYPSGGDYAHPPTSIAIGDLDRDGRNDVVVGLSGTGIAQFAQRSDGSLAAASITRTPDSRLVGVGFLDGDAFPDVVGVGWGTNTVTVFHNDGAGRLGASTAYSVTHSGYEDLELGDLNGDFLADVVVMSGQGLGPNFSVLTQLAGGDFSMPATYALGSGVLTNGIGIGEVSADSRNDVVATFGGNRPASGVAAWLGTPGQLSLSGTTPSVDVPGPVEISDIDGDGIRDVVTVHQGWGSLGVYRSLATSAAEDLFSMPTASRISPHGLAIGELTGDGYVDVAVADGGYGVVVFPGASLTPSASPAPSATSMPSPSIGTPSPQPSPTPTPTPPVSPSPSPTPNPTPSPAPPSAPRSLSASANLTSGIGLAWQAPASSGSAQVTGYKIYRGGSSGTEVPIATVNATALSFIDAAVANGASYWYQVSAFTAAGEGPRSAEILVSRGTPPSAPRSVTATASPNGITLKWTAPASNGGAAITGYWIRRSTSSGAETDLVFLAPGSTTYLDKAVTKKTRYFYVVGATNSLGVGAVSTEVTAIAK
jgi:hypothetical protein